jgi:hypothetical protein
MAAAKKRRKAADKPASRKQKPKAVAPVVAPPPAEKVIKITGTGQQHKILSSPLLNHTVGRLAAVMRRHGATEPTDSELDFGLTAFTRLEPQNTSEVLLCQQMVATHEVAMTMLTRAKMADGLPQMQESGNLAFKLLGMFERQFQALAKARKPQQVVEVKHEHRHIHAHGTPLPGPGVVTQIASQPYGAITSDPRAPALAPGPALLGEDAPADPVPVASDAQRPMPNPRRPLARRTKR